MDLHFWKVTLEEGQRMGWKKVRIIKPHRQKMLRVGTEAAGQRRAGRSLDRKVRGREQPPRVSPSFQGWVIG